VRLPCPAREQRAVEEAGAAVGTVARRAKPETLFKNRVVVPLDALFYILPVKYIRRA
jgi:hypothetical protein